MQKLALAFGCALVAIQGRRVQPTKEQQVQTAHDSMVVTLLAALKQGAAFQAPGAGFSRHAAVRYSPTVMEGSPVVGEIVDKLKSMTLLEASELTKAIEETFDVDASAGGGGGGMMMMPGAMPAAGGDAPAAADEDAQTEFTVILEAPPADKKIGILKVVRQLTEMGLMDAKKFVESCPKPLKENVSKEQSEDIKKQIEDAGGKVTLK